MVIRRWLRALAAALALVLTTLPMVALVCANECNPPREQAATSPGEHAAHCHEPATGSTSIVAKIDGACDLGALGDVAARDRATTVVDVAFAAAAPAFLTLGTDSFVPHLSNSVGRPGGTPPGAVLPLRI